MTIDSKKLAVSLLDTLRQDENVPMSVQDCVTNALILLDCQDGEDFYEAVRFANERIEKAEAEYASIVAELQ